MFFPRPCSKIATVLFKNLQSKAKERVKGPYPHSRQCHPPSRLGGLPHFPLSPGSPRQRSRGADGNWAEGEASLGPHLPCGGGRGAASEGEAGDKVVVCGFLPEWTPRPETSKRKKHTPPAAFHTHVPAAPPSQAQSARFIGVRKAPKLSASPSLGKRGGDATIHIGLVNGKAVFLRTLT